jgi:hypothetical protein
MDMIEDLRNGDGFKHYYRLAINSESATTSEEDWKKMYRSMNDMDTVIKKFTAFCPNLDIFVPNQSNKKGNIVRAEKQQKLVKKALKTIKWRVGINEVYDTLESKGDNFFFLYFTNEDDKIPRLKYLEPRNMTDIVIEDGEPVAYIYKEKRAKQHLDVSLGKVITLYVRTVTWVFEKGKTTIIDEVWDKDDKDYYKPKTDSKNAQLFHEEVILNRPSYEDEIPIVRIQSYKKFNEKFSRIPASSYLDHCLALDGINSNIDQINLMLGYPVTYIINGAVTGGERKPSGFIYVESDNPDDLKSRPDVIISQITNGLESLFKQKRAHEDALYDLSGLVNKTAQEKLGNTDSARVVATYEMPKKNKIELYVDNIIEGMELYIKILLKENNLYDEEIDNGVSLYKPKHLSQVSIFDEQLYDQNAIALGSKSKTEIALQNGDSYSDINDRKEEEVVNTETTINKESEADVRSNNN